MRRLGLVSAAQSRSVGDTGVSVCGVMKVESANKHWKNFKAI